MAVVRHKLNSSREAIAMDNRKISSLSGEIISLIEDKEYTAYEKIAALKTAASTIEHTIQAELTVHALTKAMGDLNNG